MKTIYHKMFVVLATIIALLFLGASSANAQGTYSCEWVQLTNGIRECQAAVTIPAKCNAGYQPDVGCRAFTSAAQCAAATSLTCVVIPGGGPGAGFNKTVTIAGNCGTFGTAVDTAIGCVPINDQNRLIAFFVGWGVGIAGGIALLLIIIAGFMITTSRGDPTRIKAGQELLTSAIAGVVLLIFSIFILRIVGVGILGIPIGS